MQITLQHVKAFVRQSEWNVTEWPGPRTLKAWLHDNAYRCEMCERWFSDADEVNEDRACEDCSDDDYWKGFDAQREWGTY